MRNIVVLILILLAGLLSLSQANSEKIICTNNEMGINTTVATLLNKSKRELPPASISANFHSPNEIVEIYLNAVNKGELIVFDQRLNNSILVPVRVEYIYEIISKNTTRKVFSELKEQIKVPGQDCCLIKEIGATLDLQGHIVETEVHLTTK